MKRVLLGMIMISFLVGSAWAAPMNVQVREVEVKSQPNYLSSSVGKVNYGTKVETGEEQGSWVRISEPSGWIPKSSVTKHSVKVDADKKYAGKEVSHDETALAGKGFNPQVEAEYKKQNPNMTAAYEKVDWMEKIAIPLPELNAFAAAGKLER
jgi:hypothetical protein